MSLAIGVIVAYAFLEPPWSLLLIATAIAWEGFEIWIFLRWRKVRSISGHQTLVGMKGKAVKDLRPNGQARVKGQLWNVICPEGAAAGDEVEVIEAEGMTLTVKRL
jgi:membrane protein implicated in regulation of membrane protease activity